MYNAIFEHVLGKYGIGADVRRDYVVIVEVVLSLKTIPTCSGHMVDPDDLVRRLPELVAAFVSIRRFAKSKSISVVDAYRLIGKAWDEATLACEVAGSCGSGLARTN